MRKCAHHHPGCWVGLQGCHCGLEEALADDPDVVKVLRLIHSDKNDWIPGISGVEVGQWIEQTFHVRLTDDGGWKYVEKTE